MKPLVEFLIEQIRRRWSSRWTLALALVSGGSAALIFVAEVDLSKLDLVDYAVVSLVLIAIIAVWYFTNRVPRTKKGVIGFVLAITAEKESQARRLRSDFGTTIRELLTQSPGLYKFELIEYSKNQSAKVTAGTAARYLLKSRARFMVYGRARMRRVGGDKYHVLNLEGVVAHAALPPKTAQAFSAEFQDIFPRKLRIHKEIDLLAFEITAELIDVIARYIVGIAAMVSGDLDYAEELFRELRSRLGPVKVAVPAVIKVRQRVPTRLRELHDIQLQLVRQAFFLRRDMEDLRRADVILEKLEQLGRLDYSQTLTKAMCEFLLRRNVKKAKRLLRNCHGHPDATWRYSLAFLFAYTGDIQKARRLYQVAFHSEHLDTTVPIQTEEFIRLVLHDEPEVCQLYYCLGLINYFVKKDMASALRDFKDFLAGTTESRFVEARAEAQALLEKAEEELAESGDPEEPA